MHYNVIQRQYDEVIAPHYDLDPQSVTGDSLDRAIEQIRQQLGRYGRPLKVLDLGMGTGKFFEKLRPHVGPFEPFGIDISQQMISIAHTRIPDLVAAVDDAANLDAHFGSESFDLICTHFITGFVPMAVLAPKIWSRLAEGGYWSLIGGTKAGFPVLQKKAQGKAAKWLFKGKGLGVDNLVCNPADQAEVVSELQGNGFLVRACETFTPRVNFKNFTDFMEFAYYGGWLTPFVESLGLHRMRPLARAMVNALFFPAQDHHSIEIALAQKPRA